MITVTIAGRLGKDAEVRQTQASAVCSFSVAANTGYGDSKQVHWFDCSIWGKQGEALAQYLTKGSAVTITGEYSEREHDGKAYKQLRVNQIELQGSKGDSAAPAPATYAKQPQGQQPQGYATAPPQQRGPSVGSNGEVFDDDLPF